MKENNLLVEYDEQMRHSARVAGCVREDADTVVRYTTQSGSLRYILWHRFDEACVASMVEREVSAARGKANALIWKVYAQDEPSAALAAHLVSRGFEENDPSTLLIAPVATILDNVRAKPDGLTICPLTTPKSLDAYLDIWNDVWPNCDNARYVEDYRKLLAQENPDVVFFAAFADGNPVSAGYMFHANGSPFALLCGGSTKSGWRGKRIYTALVAERAHRARERGAKFLSVEASPESLPILQSLGFEPLSTLAFYELKFTQQNADRDD
jgi:Acetyltransferase (GNAT) domain